VRKSSGDAQNCDLLGVTTKKEKCIEATENQQQQQQQPTNNNRLIVRRVLCCFAIKQNK
jgi:hypothetical protein